jgi:hypothetical protein
MYEVFDGKNSQFRVTQVIVSNIEDVIDYFTEVGIAEGEYVLFGPSDSHKGSGVNQWLEADSRKGFIHLKVKPTRKSAIKRLTQVYDIENTDWSGRSDNLSFGWLLQLTVKAA